MNGKNQPGTGKKVRLIALVAIVGAAVTAASCNSGTAPQLTSRIGQLAVRITDAPDSMLASADIWVSRVYLKGEGESQHGDSTASDSTSTDSTAVVDLFNDPTNPRHYDLLTLQDSVTAELAAATNIDVGNYDQLRIVVDSARVTLANGYFFADSSASMTLHVPSGAESGIKVELEDALGVASDSTTTITVDFNVADNFVFQMNQNGTIRQILFKPVIRERSRHMERSADS
jgi:hypothetical protein